MRHPPHRSQLWRREGQRVLAARRGRPIAQPLLHLERAQGEAIQDRAHILLRLDRRLHPLLLHRLLLRALRLSRLDALEGPHRRRVELLGVHVGEHRLAARPELRNGLKRAIRLRIDFATRRANRRPAKQPARLGLAHEAIVAALHGRAGVLHRVEGARRRRLGILRALAA